MLRPTKCIPIALLASVLVVPYAGRAQTEEADVEAAAATASTTTSTSTSTSTTTTLAPHRFSPATAACIHTAKEDFKQCAGAAADCLKAYQTAYAQCFAGAAGQKCASKCLTNESTCITKVPTTRASCLKTCRTNKKKDTRACRLQPEGDDIWASGDQGCLVTKDTNFTVCKFSCSEAKMVCHTNFNFCIANCPNQ
jgi:hypothetical protein